MLSAPPSGHTASTPLPSALIPDDVPRNIIGKDSPRSLRPSTIVTRTRSNPAIDVIPIPNTVSSGRFVPPERVLDAAGADRIAQPFEQALGSRRPLPERPCASVTERGMRAAHDGIVEERGQSGEARWRDDSGGGWRDACGCGRRPRVGPGARPGARPRCPRDRDRGGVGVDLAAPRPNRDRALGGGPRVRTEPSTTAAFGVSA